MIDWADIANGILEMIAMSVVVIQFNQEKNFSAGRIAAFLLPACTLISFINSFDLPYHAVFTVAAASLLAVLILRISVVNAVVDYISALAVCFFSELICNVFFIAFARILPVDEGILIFPALVLIIVIVWKLAENDRVQSLLAVYYYPNRRIILWAWLMLLIVCTLVINLWSPDQTMYSNKRIELLILALLYAAVNIVYVRSLLEKRSAEKELFKAHEYEEYLHDLMEKMRSREHEYKNHIQHILMLTETGGPDSREKRIRDYAAGLIDPASPPVQGVPTDNLAAAVFLYQAKKRAEQEKVRLEYDVDRPFPQYRIPEKELVELVSNAINNAFEAVADLEEEKRKIFLLFRKNRIEVVNTMAYRKDVPYAVSTKGSGRGYGRLNMDRIARKHGIRIDAQIEDERFIVQMHF